MDVLAVRLAARMLYLKANLQQVERYMLENVPLHSRMQGRAVSCMM